MSSSSSGHTAAAPILSPDIAKDLAIYEEDMAILAEVKEKLKKLAASIQNHGNVMYEVIEVFSLYQDEQASQIRSLSAVDNLDSTIRGKLSTAQNDWNAMSSGKMTNSNGQSDASNMVKQIQQIEAFIKYEKAQGKNSILDQASLKNLQSAIDSIKSNWGKSWGNTSDMDAQMKKWIGQIKNGTQVPAMKNIQDGFQTLNQSVSELSATTNSQLQFVENQYKQGLGEEHAAMQAYQKLNANTIRHFNGN